MSAYGYKRTFTHTVIYVRFTPESGHREPDFGVSENRQIADGNETLATRREDDSGFALWGWG